MNSIKVNEMKVALLCLNLCLMSFSLNAQTDSFRVRSGVSVNGGELIDIIKGEENFRLAYEKKVAGHFSVLGEAGIYFSGYGYNYRLELKWYIRNFFLDPKPDKDTRWYMAIDYFQKDHSYHPKVNFWTDSTHQGTTYRRTFADKMARAAHLIVGFTNRDPGDRDRWATFEEVYFGLGVRFKTVAGISKQTFDMIESDYSDIFLQSGVWPDFTVGVRVGLDFGRRHK